MTRRRNNRSTPEGRELAAAEMDIHDRKLSRHERKHISHRDRDWENRLDALENRLSNEYHNRPELAEMIASGGKSKLVAPDVADGGQQTVLTRFKDIGTVSPDPAGNVAFCVTPWPQFFACLYTLAGFISLGDQVGLDPTQRSSRRNVFAQSFMKNYRAIAAGLEMWLTGSFQQTQGQIAVAVVPHSLNINTTFAAVADLPGAVVMSAAEVYQRGLFIPWLASAVREIANVQSGPIATTQQVAWAPDEMENFQVVDQTSPATMWNLSHFVRPAIVVSAENLDPNVDLVCTFTHAYQAAPLFDFGMGDHPVAAGTLEEAHRQVSNLLTPEYLQHHGADEPGGLEGDAKLYLPTIDSEEDRTMAVATNVAADKAPSSGATDLVKQVSNIVCSCQPSAGKPAVQVHTGDDPPGDVAKRVVTRHVATRRAGHLPGQVPRSMALDESTLRRMLSKRLEEGGRSDDGFINRWTKRARAALKKNFPDATDGYFAKTKANAGHALGTVLDALEFVAGTQDDLLKDPNVKQLGQLALAAV